MLGKSDLGAPSSSRPSAPLTAQLGKLSCGSQRWTAPSIFAAAGKDARSGASKSASSFFNRRAEERLPLLADLEAGSFGYYGSFRARLVGTSRSDSEGHGAGCWCLPSLTYRQRLIGCAFCFTSGLVLLATSLLSLTSLLHGNPAPFAVKYTLGNLFCVSAIGFLVGWGKMCRSMLVRERRGATLLYLSSLAATLGCVFLMHSAILTATAIMFQLAAMAWHGVSYLPFGPRTLRFCTRSAFRLLPF
mmetsp:Transcript_4573/g.14994  ORF Transcript_4573/g.14994 Transcript_4573/m.14994 type:complete len:246 (+) Transcript_4573:50-787(+)